MAGHSLHFLAAAAHEVGVEHRQRSPLRSAAPSRPQRHPQPDPLPAGGRSWREAAFRPAATRAVSTIRASGAPIAPGGGGATAAAAKTTASRAERGACTRTGRGGR